jgi:hypothetical protein
MTRLRDVWKAICMTSGRRMCWLKWRWYESLALSLNLYTMGASLSAFAYGPTIGDAAVGNHVRAPCGRA